MANVKLYVPVSEGVKLHVDRELDYLELIVGDWFVELRADKLTVRSVKADIQVLKVDA